MLHHRQSLVCEGQLLEFLAAKLVAQLHAVFQQYLRLSQARVHAWRKCMGRMMIRDLTGGNGGRRRLGRARNEEESQK